MKKFARNFLKSADEKLRNIGNKPQGSKQSSPSGPSPHEEGEVMAERRIQTRTGRRERFRGGDGVRGQVEHHKAEIKRRSRSEGPHSRVSRPKEDETFESYPKNEKIMGPIFAVTHSSTATRVSRYSPPLSDEGGFVHVQEVAGSDTDSSDSDRKVWTKNPLVVRKTRRTGRSEKRQSNIENGFSNRTSNRESFVYYGSGQDKSDSSGTGSLKGSKYQKLEELRRRRIDIQVTSDEEVQNTPASRISRLRQRAIQSGLGKQDRHSSIEPAAAAAAPIVPSSSNQSYIQKTPLQNGTNVYSNQGQSTNVQPVYQVGSNTPSVVAPKSFQHSSQVIDNSSQNKVFSSNQKQKRQSQEIKPFDQKGFSDSGIVQASNLPANFTVHSQIQHNISEPQPSSFTKTVHGGEIVQKKIFDRPRVPSADSIYDSVFDDPSAKQNINRTSFSTYHNVGHGFVYMRPASGNVMEKPKEASGFVQNGHQMPATSNEVVELRLKTNRVLDRPPSIQGTPAKLVLNRVNSDDSLDELIESNIQYLDQEIDKSKRRSTTHVSKSASLPDSRHFSGLQMPESGVIMPVRSEMRIPFSGSQSQGLSEWQHPKQTHISRGSELQFHIPVGTGTYHPPEIYIADENRQGSFSSVHSEMAGQTNSGYVGGMYGGASLHPGTSGERKLSYDSRTTYTFPGSEFHDRDMSKSDTQLNSNLPVYRDTVNPSYSQPYSSSADPLVQRTELSVPTFDRGMFSDVEYNIEVADRVKKWEKFMKKRSEVTDESLTTIQEQDILPRDVRRSMFLDQRINIPKSPTVSVSQSFTWTGVSLKPSSSDPTINMAGNQHVFSQQTNHIVIQEPVTGSKYATSALSSIYVPGPQKASPGLMSAADLRKHMVANKQPVDDHSVQTLTSPNPVNCRYQELDELQEAKSETVKDLCKMFDISFQNEGQVMPGEEKFSKMSPSQADSDTNWTQLISDLETKIKETEVWSPEMESQEGDLVSIERVKARTLQTIPFSEDPFWKEIEEMTSFEKLFKPEEFDDALAFRSANQLEFAPSQSNTLPSQPRMSARDRLTRSKSLYTPNITPLTITVDKYNGPNALDDVLEDIRVSLEKQSPKVRRGGDSSDSHRSSPGPTQADIQRSRSNYWERTSVPQTQGLLIYANQNQTDSKPQMSYPGMEQYPNVVNGNYQLDPDILKQKLLKTGLVDENKKAVTRQYQQKPSPLIIPPPPQFYAPAPQPLISQPIRTSRQSEEKRNEVNQSMEELRQLAVDVERKVSMIKSKIVRADENNLDKILMTLKKFAPTVQSRSPEPKADSFHDFYVKKKSKLSEALFELDKIYDGLQLDDSSVIEQVKRQDYPPYRRPSPIGQQKQDEKPEISSSISFQVSKPAAHKVEQRTDTDFDAIQRSFQAILDEVNQTAATKTEAGTVPANVMSSRYQPTVVKTATSSFSQPRLQTAFNKTITTSAPTPVVSSQVQTSGAKTVSSTIPTTIVQPTKTETVPSKPSVVSSFQQVEKSPEVKRRSIVSSARTVFQPAVKSEKEGIQAAVSSTVVDMAGNRQNSGKSGVIPQMPVVSSLKTKIPPETSPKPKRQNLQSRRGVSSVTLTPAPVLVPPETSPKPKRSADKTLSVTCVALSSSPAVAYSSSTVSMPRPKPPQTTSVSQTPTKQVTKTSVSVATTQNPPTSACSLDINQRENLTANVSKLMNQTSNQAGGMTQQSQSVSITLKTPTSSSSSSGQPANAASMQTSKSPRERRSRTRFRAKNPDLIDDDVAVRKARSKSTPRIDSQTTAITPSPTSADYLNPRESTPPQSRIRIRPEKEADLMHDDMAYRNLRKDITIEPPKMPTTTTTTATACSAIEIELKSPVNSAAGTPQTKPKFDKTVDLTKAKNFTDRSSSASSSAVDSPKLKTVETQTSADEQKSARSRFRQRQEGKRRMGKGIAMMLEIFSSSDDDRRMRPLHTRSAPDLSLIGNEGDDEGAEEEEEKTKNEIHVTTSSGQREMQAEHFGDNKMKLDSVDCSETSATNKPPAHPVKKSSGSPEKITSSSAEQSVEKDVSCSEKFSKFSLRTRKGRSPEREVQSDTTMEIQERPKSFHELLENFEQGENRRHALKSLRKCASEDTVAMETVVKKAYQSDPYLSEPNLRHDDPRIPSQEGRVVLNIELKVRS